MTAKQPAKRGRPARAASDSQAGAIDIQAIVAAAVAQAVAQTIATMQPAAPVIDAKAIAKAQNGDLENDEGEELTIAQEQAAQREKKARIDDLVGELLPLLMQERHRVVFDWYARKNGQGPAATLLQMVRTEVARLTPGWREDQGMGGKTTKDPETMARLKEGME